ncbi:hypothetical protein AN958_04075 [Leucoagaricus sp. SymC.cos]|nr:hypothetical protein AN958_04075 [Leucoagaricus sp. SymC.cos]
MMTLLSTTSRAPAPFARSLMLLVIILSIAGTFVDVAAAPYNRNTRMARLQDPVHEVHHPSRTLKQFDPRKPRPQRVRRAGRTGPSHRPENSNSNGSEDGNDNDNDNDGGNGDDNDTDDKENNDDEVHRESGKKEKEEEETGKWKESDRNS